MKQEISINDFQQIGNKLYKKENQYYILCAKGIVNGWLLKPVLRQLLDIDISTGKYIFSSIEISFCAIGGIAQRDFELI